MPRISSTPCNVPSSPGRPCRTLKAMSGLSVRSAVATSRPTSTRVTRCPLRSSASAQALPERSDTSRSADQPPIRTTTCFGLVIIDSQPPIQTSSCPRLSRASMSFFRRIRKQGVDGRDEHGHDEVERPSPHTPASNLLRHANPFDLPFEIDAGCFPHARAHNLAERLDVGRAGAALVDEEVAMQLRYLGGTHRQSAAAGSLNELPCLAAGRILEGRATGATLGRLGRLAAFRDLVHLGA